jgi:hypothetical protein
MVFSFVDGNRSSSDDVQRLCKNASSLFTVPESTTIICFTDSDQRYRRDGIGLVMQRLQNSLAAAGLQREESLRRLREVGVIMASWDRPPMDRKVKS